MEDLLIEVLESFGFPVILQGSLGNDEDYPEHFFTFWNNSSDGESFYNNEETRIIGDYDVNFYSVDPNLVYEKLREAKSKLKKAGFIVSGDGHSVMSDEPTHTGRGLSVLFSKNI